MPPKKSAYDTATLPVAEQGKPYYLPDGIQVCGAKLADGTPCFRNAMRGVNRCRKHGGTAVRGPLHHNYKTGRYSRAIPGNLMQAYERSLQDDELLSLRDEIALLDSRLDDCVKALPNAGADLGSAVFLHARMVAAIREGDADAMGRAVTELGSVLSDAQDATRGWEHVIGLLEARRRLVESERRRLVDMQMMIDSSRAVALMMAFIDIVRRRVHDDTVIREIGTDVRGLLNSAGRQ